MPSFELKSQLSQRTQDEITRIEAIASAQRTTTEANFLTALAPYRTNAVLRYDTTAIKTPQNPNPQASTDDIIEAEGNTLPTAYSGFKQGALFRDLDKSGMNIYINVGTNTSASWTLLGQIMSASPSLSLSPSPSVSVSLSGSFSPSLSSSLSASLSKS